jgi:hypothetical protein
LVGRVLDAGLFGGKKDEEKGNSNPGPWAPCVVIYTCILDSGPGHSQLGAAAGESAAQFGVSGWEERNNNGRGEEAFSRTGYKATLPH